MKSLVTILCFATIFLVGCNGSQAYVLGEVGPVDVKIAVDNNGNVTVSGGVSPDFSIGLGPVELQVGIEQTLELTREGEFKLFIIWVDVDGEVWREEYDIGKDFQIVFDQSEQIQEIQGDNDSIIVVVSRPGNQSFSSDSGIPPSTQNEAPGNTESTSSSFNTTSLTPEEFIQEYFALINSRNYQSTWSMLSNEFQSRHTYSEYTDFWDSVGRLEILLIDVQSQNNSQAIVYVEAQYHYNNGSSPIGHTTYKLISDGNSWLFAPN